MYLLPRPIKIIAVRIFICLGFLFSTPSFGSDDRLCESMTLLKKQMLITTSSQTVTDRSNQQIEKWNFLKKAADIIFKSYRQGEIQTQTLNECFTDSQEKSTLNSVLPGIFLKKSLEILEKSQSDIIVKLAKSVLNHYKNSHTFSFKLVGHMKEDQNSTKLKGGFHRGKKSVFMDFSKIPPNEWLIILIHELLHSQDFALRKAITDYGDLEIGPLIYEWNTVSSEPEDLTAGDRKRLNKWLKAGLDRGLIAEYRAWTYTFIIYQEGLKDQLWEPIAWLDQILNLKKSSEDIKDFTYRYLDSRFTEPNDPNDPADNIFNLPLIKNEIENIRNEYKRRPPSLSMDFFKN